MAEELVQDPPGTVADLGRKVKEKYPQYKDLPDEEVGRKVKEKYPDAYGAFTDLPGKPVASTPQEPKASPFGGGGAARTGLGEFAAMPALPSETAIEVPRKRLGQLDELGQQIKESTQRFNAMDLERVSKFRQEELPQLFNEVKKRDNVLRFDIDELKKSEAAIEDLRQKASGINTPEMQAQLEAAYNSAVDKYNSDVRFIQKQQKYLHDMAMAVERDSINSARREYALKSEQGGFWGATWNNILDSVGSSVAGMNKILGQTIVSTAGQFKGKEWEERQSKNLNAVLSDMRDVPRKAVGDAATTEEYVQEMHKGFLGGAWLGATGSLAPAFMGPGGAGLIFQAADGVQEEMESPEFADISEREKTMFAFTVGAIIGRLERAGLVNAARTKGVAQNILLKAIDRMPAGAKPEQIRNILNAETDSYIKNFGLRVLGGSIAEGETETLQGLAEPLMKDVFNAAYDKQLIAPEKGEKGFDTPNGFAEYVGDALRQGAQGALGGAMYASPAAVSGLIRDRKVGATTTNAQYEVVEQLAKDPEFEASFKDELSGLVERARVSKAKADQIISDWKEAQGIMAKIPPDLDAEKRRAAFDLLTEKSQLSKMDKSLVSDRIDEIDRMLMALAADKMDANEGEPTIIPLEGTSLDGIVGGRGSYKLSTGETVEGDVYLDGQTVVIETKDRVYEVGNVEDLAATTKEQLPLTAVAPTITVTEDGDFVYSGNDEDIAQGVVVPQGAGLKAIKRDKKGDIKRIVVTDADGNTKNLRGQEAEDLAYHMMLRAVENNQSTLTRDDSIKEEIDAEHARQTQGTSTTKADADPEKSARKRDGGRRATTELAADGAVTPAAPTEVVEPTTVVEDASATTGAVAPAGPGEVGATGNAVVQAAPTDQGAPPGVQVQEPGSGDGVETPYITKGGKPYGNFEVRYDASDGTFDVKMRGKIKDTWSNLPDKQAKKEKRRAERAAAAAMRAAEREYSEAFGVERKRGQNAIEKNKEREKRLRTKALKVTDEEQGAIGIVLGRLAGGQKISRESVRKYLGWGAGRNEGANAKVRKTDEEKSSEWALSTHDRLRLPRMASDSRRHAGHGATDEGRRSRGGTSISELANQLYNDAPKDQNGDPLPGFGTADFEQAIAEVISGYKDRASVEDAYEAHLDATIDAVLTDEQRLEQYHQGILDGLGETDASAEDVDGAIAQAEDEFFADKPTDEEADKIFGSQTTPTTDESKEGQRIPKGSEGGQASRRDTEEEGRAPQRERADPEEERLVEELKEARRVRDKFVNDFNDRGQGLFAPEVGQAQQTIDGGFDNSEANFQAKVEPLNERVRQATKALADYVDKAADRKKAAAQQTSIDQAPATPVNMTETSVINRDYRKLKEDLGEKKAKKYFEQVDRLFNPNSTRVVEYRKNGVVTESDGKRTFHALADMDSKKWRVSFSSGIEDVSPSNDTKVGKNAAGEQLYDRADGSRYRMRFDRKDRPSGYPDFGGDLSPVEAPAKAEAPLPKKEEKAPASFKRPDAKPVTKPTVLRDIPATDTAPHTVVYAIQGFEEYPVVVFKEKGGWKAVLRVGGLDMEIASGEPTHGIAATVAHEKMARAGKEKLDTIVQNALKAEGLKEAAKRTVVSEQRPTLPPTITINGKERPTTNSKGQPIAQTEEGVRNFYAWFGESKVVDEQGRPLVVYHGTPEGGFTIFDQQKIGSVTDSGWIGRGFYFSDEKSTATMYAVNRTGPKKEVYEVYAKMDNPFMWGQKGYGVVGFIKNNEPLPGGMEDLIFEKTGFRQESYERWRMDGRGGMSKGEMDRLEAQISKIITEELSKRGHDGVIANFGKLGGGEYVVFDPTQIKSATGNSGAFDPKNLDITQQRPTDRAPKTGKPNTDKAMKALQGVAPGFKVIAPSNKADYQKAIENFPDGVKSSWGLYDQASNTAYINPEGLDARNTLFHESGHPLIAALRQNQPEKFKAFYDSIEEQYKKYAKEKYADKSESVQQDEALTQFIADVADGTIPVSTKPDSLWQKFKAFIQDLLASLGWDMRSIDMSKPDNVRAFAAQFKKAMDKGIKITGLEPVQKGGAAMLQRPTTTKASEWNAAVDDAVANSLAKGEEQAIQDAASLITDPEGKAEFIRMMNEQWGVTTPPAGTKANQKKVSKVYLRDELRTAAQVGARTGIADVAKARKAFVEQVKDVLSKDNFKGALSATQARVITTRAARVNPLNPKIVDRFIAYAEKVAADATYAEQMERVRTAQRGARRRNHSQFPSAVNDFLRIDPEAIPDEMMRDYMEAVADMSKPVPSYRAMQDMFYPLMQATRRDDNPKTPPSVGDVETLWETMKQRQVNSFEDYKAMLSDIGRLKTAMRRLSENDKADTQEVEKLIKEIETALAEFEQRFAEDIAFMKERLVEDIVSRAKGIDLTNITEETKALLKQAYELSDAELMGLSPDELVTLSDILDNVEVDGYVDVFRLDPILAKAQARSAAPGINEQIEKAKDIKSQDKRVERMSTKDAAFWEAAIGLGRIAKGAFHQYLVAPLQRAAGDYIKQVQDGRGFFSKLKKKHGINEKALDRIGMMAVYLREYALRFDPALAGKKDDDGMEYGKRDWFNKILKDGDDSVYGPALWRRMQKAYEALPKDSDGQVDPQAVYDAYVNETGAFLPKNEVAFLKEAMAWNAENLTGKQRTANYLRGKPFNELMFHVYRKRIDRKKSKDAIEDAPFVLGDNGNVRIASATGKEVTDNSIAPIAFNYEQLFDANLENVARDYHFTPAMRRMNAVMGAVRAEGGKRAKQYMDVAGRNIQDAMNNEFVHGRRDFFDKGVSNLLAAKAKMVFITPFRTLYESIAGYLSYGMRAGTMRGYAQPFKDNAIVMDLMDAVRSPLRNRKNLSKFIEIEKGAMKERGFFEKVTHTFASATEGVLLKPIWYARFQDEFADITGKEFDAKRWKDDEGYRYDNRKAIDRAAVVADAAYEAIVGSTTAAGNRRNIDVGLGKMKAKTTRGRLASFMTGYAYREWLQIADATLGMVQLMKDEGAAAAVSKRGRRLAGGAVGVLVSATTYNFLMELHYAVMNLLSADDDEEKNLALAELDALLSWEGSLREMGTGFTSIAASKYSGAGRQFIKGIGSIMYNSTTDPEKREAIRSLVRNISFQNPYDLPLKNYQDKDGMYRSIAEAIPAVQTAVENFIMLKRSAVIAHEAATDDKEQSDWEESVIAATVIVNGFNALAQFFGGAAPSTLLNRLTTRYSVDGAERQVRKYAAAYSNAKTPQEKEEAEKVLNDWIRTQPEEDRKTLVRAARESIKLHGVDPWYILLRRVQSPEDRAEAAWSKMKGMTPEERKEAVATMKRVGGIATDRFIARYKELEAGGGEK